MSTPRSQTLEGRFKNVIYSPKGEIEGALLDSGGSDMQIAIDKHDVDAAAAWLTMTAGQSVKVRALPRGPSDKGPAQHPVCDLGALLAVDGVKPNQRKVDPTPAYRGRVVRFNFARHGAANGVVLDSGDFIHTKPEGLAKLHLQVGDLVEADGDAQRLADDAGWAVEATAVNGMAIRPH